MRDSSHDNGYHTIVVSSDSEARARKAAIAALTEAGHGDLVADGNLKAINKRTDNGGTCIAYQD